MTQVVQAPSSARSRGLTAVISGLVVFGAGVAVQPVLEPPPLAPVLLSAFVGASVLLLLLSSGRGWGHPISAALGAVIAGLVYVVLWIAAAPTGFPSNTFGSSDAEILEVFLAPDGTRLEVGVGTCNQDPNVTAVETADEVRLSSNEKVPRGDSADCADADNVMLEQPLGERKVIDEATGKVLQVLPGETCKQNPQQPEC